MNRNKRLASTVPNHIILLILTFIAFAPILVLFMNSVKTSAEISVNPLGFPRNPQFQNFSEAWETARYSTTFLNSLILTGGSIIGVVVLSGLGGFALARLNLRGADLLTFYFLVGTSVPAQLFIVPLFIQWRDVGLYNTYLGVIIIYVALFSPFSTYLLRAYMLSIPEEFVEAARLDGASQFQVFRHVIMPLTWPGFLTVALVVGLWSWNEFLFAVTFLPDPDMKPVSTGLFAFQDRYSRNWGLTNAAAVIMIAPIIVLFLFLQRRFIEGLTQGGLKG